MKTRSLFEIEIGLRLSKAESKKRLKKYGPYVWKKAVCFLNVPTKEQVVQAIKQDFSKIRKEREWTENKYHISQYTEGDRSSLYYKVLEKEILEILAKNELPRKPKSWAHIGRICQMEKDFMISISKSTIYVP